MYRYQWNALKRSWLRGKKSEDVGYRVFPMQFMQGRSADIESNPFTGTEPFYQLTDLMGKRSAGGYQWNSLRKRCDDGLACADKSDPHQEHGPAIMKKSEQVARPRMYKKKLYQWNSL